MHIKKLPYLTLLISLAILVNSYSSYQHDQRQWSTVQDLYNDTFFKFEAPIYLDFLKRKLNVEGEGSPEHISALTEAVEKNNKLSVIQAMVKDASFETYMNKHGNSFLQDNDFTQWKEHRQTVTPYYHSTSSQEFGLSRKQFQPRQIITHFMLLPFKLVYLPIFMSLIIIMGCFEWRLGTFRLYCYTLLAALVCTLSYLALSTKNSPVLVGSLAISYGLVSPLLLHLFYRRKHKEEEKSSFKVILTSVCLSILGTLFYTTLIIRSFDPSLIFILSTIVFPILASILFMHISMRITANEPVSNSSSRQAIDDWPYRAEYSKALEFLSRFEFNAARQTLNALASKYPDSPTLLEQRYHLAKFHPEDTLYWKLARNLIELCTQNKDYARICRLFNDIQKNAASKQRAQECLDPNHYHKIMMLLIEQGDLFRAEQAFHFLEIGADKHIIQDACIALIQEFKVRHSNAKQQQYEMLLERLKA